ncbi:MAG: FKBP-type peptidyl-prolyl cis-trans isomerase [Thermoplasmata archaeon]
MKDGDIIRLDYTLWYVENDKEEIYDTTIEQVAKDNGIHDPNKRYAPEVIILGKGMILEELEKKIRESEIGKEYDVYLEPAQAYGERNSDLLKIHSWKEFDRNKIVPEPGKYITLNGNKGKVISVSPGRILVDYNHPLAGKKVHYRYTVNEIVDGLENKTKAMIELGYNKDLDKFSIKIYDDRMEIIVPDSCKYGGDWTVAKFYIIGFIRDFFDKPINITEIYNPPEKAKPMEKENRNENPEEKNNRENVEENKN